MEQQQPPGRGRLGLAIVGAAIALVLAVGFAATRIGGLQGSVPYPMDGGPAPELSGIDAWLNAEPFTLASLRGGVVLVDFWTYSCINCIRTVPQLRALHHAYGPYGLTVVGVHSPEFAFEREVDNVRAALDRYDVPYPVALDNEMATWRAYENRFWPHQYLIDAQGVIRFDHIGEGGHDELQQHIRSLMREAGLELPPPVRFNATEPAAGRTPEVYAGFERGAPGGFLANPEGYVAGESRVYGPVEPEAVEGIGTGGSFFLEGPWRIEAEFIEAAGEGARVILPYRARDVFAVMAGDALIRVLLDGGPIRESVAGGDVRGSVVRVGRSDLFRLVRTPEVEEHVLTIEAEPGLRLFTFTFG